MSDPGLPEALPEPSGILDGVRILSLAEQYPGPYATLLLSDLGADVVLVERPAGGDPSRKFPWFFEALNRNKRAIALDLKDPRGAAAFRRLSDASDVVLEGFRPRVMERLGVGYERLASSNHRLVYVSISGFGRDGPYRDRPAHDVSYQAIAGMLHDLTSASAPLPAPSVQVGDLSSGIFAAFGTVSALYARERSGQGMYLDVSVTDVLVSMMTVGIVPVVNGTGPPGFPHEPGYGLYGTADGRLLSLSIAHEDGFWRALCETVGLQQLADLTATQRLERKPELVARLQAILVARPLQWWTEAFAAAGVPFGPVHDLEEVALDPQIAARGMLVNVPAGEGRPTRRHVRQPLVFGGRWTGPTRHAPALGEHTREVLAEAGWSDADIDALLTDGVALQQGASVSGTTEAE